MEVRSTIAALTLIALASAATAQVAQPNPSPLYGELGYTWIKAKEAGYELKPGVLRGIIGYEFSRFAAVEGMLGVGVQDDSVRFMGVDVTGEVERAFGVYVKPKFNVTRELEVFARLGYADVKVKASALGISATDSDSDFSYGVGASYTFNRIYTALDYMVYHDKDGAKADGFTLSIGYRF